MSKQAILFARVSTKGQKDNFSLPSQFAAMREYAARNGFTVIEEISDTYTGTAAVADRPGGAKVYDYLNRRAVNVIVMYTIDRAARDEEVVEYAVFKRDCKRAGAELHFVDTGKTSDDPMGSMFEYFKAAGAADERKKILERMNRGKRQKVEGGKWIGCSIPYGYRKVGKGKESRLEIDDFESSVVKRIFILYLGLNDEKPKATTAIAKLLTDEGIPPPSRGAAKRGRGWARGWHMQTINLILKQKAYLGELRYVGQIIHLPELAFISPQVWQAAQERRAKNAAQCKRERKCEYLLADGYLRCTCGASMIARHSISNAKGEPYLYYVCNRKARAAHLRQCDEKLANVRRVDTVVWEWLYELISNETKLANGIREWRERNQNEVGPKRQRLETVVELLQKAQRKVKGLAAAYSEALGNKQTSQAEALDEQLKLASKQCDAYLAERNALMAELSQVELTPEREATIYEFVRAVGARINGATFDQKREALEIFDFSGQITYKDDERGVYVICSISVELEFLPIDTSRSKENGKIKASPLASTAQTSNSARKSWA